MYDNATEVYNKYPEIHFVQYMVFSDAKNRMLWSCQFLCWNILPQMPALKKDEDVKKEEGLEF